MEAVENAHQAGYGQKGSHVAEKFQHIFQIKSYDDGKGSSKNSAIEHDGQIKLIFRVLESTLPSQNVCQNDIRHHKRDDPRPEAVFGSGIDRAQVNLPAGEEVSNNPT